MLIEKEMKLKKNRRGFLICVIIQRLMEVIDFFFVRDGSKFINR